jgi:uncharacterized protein
VNPRVFSFLFFIACASTAPKSSDANKDTAPAAAPSVTLASEDGQAWKVNVEVANTPSLRANGLMNRASLAEDAGMIFLFPKMDALSFWMKNTLIPLDMIFIRDDFSIAGIVENAEPLTLDPRGVGVPSQYVLEVNGGAAARHGIKAGSRVRFDDIPAAPSY